MSGYRDAAARGAAADPVDVQGHVRTWPGPSVVKVYFGIEQGSIVRVMTDEKDAISWLGTAAAAAGRVMFIAEAQAFTEVRVVSPQPYLEVAR